MGPITRTQPAHVVGAGLVILGILAVAVRWAGLDTRMDVGGAWPVFVIVPGLVLFAAAFTLTPPRGVGFAIAGSIVTMTGLVLWAQQVSGRYDTWAYVWAIVGPGGAGIGMLLYSMLAGAKQFFRPGLLLTGIALVLFAAGAWYFEPVLTEGRQPIDLEVLWPAILIVIGGLVLASAYLRPHRGLPTQHT